LETNVNCKINNFYFRIEQSEDKLSQDFIDFLHSYFEGKKIEEDVDLNLRFYTSILQSYIEFLKNPDNIIIKGWEEDIKPFLLKTYPFNKNGIFNINADIKFLINDIDDMIKRSNNNNIIINNDNNSKEDNNIIYEDREEFEDDLDVIKIDIEEKINNDKTEINKIKESFKEEYKDDYDIDRLKTHYNQKSHSSTIASKSTSASFNDEQNEKNNIIKTRFSLQKQKEISPNFSDVFETQGFTIIKENKIILQMTYNLFLKKIVVGDFFKDYLEYVINFSEQCFYFMKREIVFRKIIDCYNYYIEIKVPFEQRKNLIDFMSLLIIKLYHCFQKIVQEEEIIIIIKQFYNDRINELKQIIEKKKQKKGHTLQDIFFDGINYIKNGVNKLVNNENKEKEKEKKINEIKQEIDIKENLNAFLSKRKQMIDENKLENNIFNEENHNKEKEEKKEKEELSEEKKEKKLSKEEQTLQECEEIINIIKYEMPKPEILSQVENSLVIYKFLKNFNLKNENSSSGNFKRKMNKSNTQRILKTLNPEEKQSKNNKNGKKLYFSCFNYDVEEIGEKLINISLKSLNKIKRKELYNGAFLKKSKLITSPNVLDTINKFNRLISFIIEDILSYDYPQDRANVLERWVQIAEYLKKRNDYGDVLAINSALKNYVITGLYITWKEVSNKTKKIIKELDYLCCFEKNYKNLRDKINSLNKNEFYLPYLGMLLKDLNFYEEKSKYIINGNMINFEKINGVQKTIDDFFRFQQIKDKKNVELNEELNFFENLDDKTEAYLEEIGSKLEPKFALYNNPKKIKRLTYIDKNFFRGSLKRGSLVGSIKYNINQ